MRCPLTSNSHRTVECRKKRRGARTDDAVEAHVGGEGKSLRTADQASVDRGENYEGQQKGSKAKGNSRKRVKRIHSKNPRKGEKAPRESRKVLVIITKEDREPELEKIGRPKFEG